MSTQSANPVPVFADATVVEFLRDFERATEAFALASEVELELQALRGIRKDEAVRRIMQARGIAATPAEKIVEEDEEYFAFLRECRSSVANRIRREADQHACRVRLDLATKLAAASETPQSRAALVASLAVNTLERGRGPVGDEVAREAVVSARRVLAEAETAEGV